MIPNSIVKKQLRTIPGGSFRSQREENLELLRGQSGDYFKVGDHFRVGNHLGDGIISGAVQTFMPPLLILQRPPILLAERVSGG